MSLALSRRRQWHPTPVLLPGKSHGWRSLVGCSLWGHEESDTTELLHFHFSLFMHWRKKWQPIPVFLPGESQGWGAWWATVYGVAQSRTRLKWLSSSSSGSMLRVGYDWASSLSLFTFMHWRRKWQPTPVFLPGESQGRGSLVGCRLWGRTESDTTEVT